MLLIDCVCRLIWTCSCLQREISCFVSLSLLRLLSSLYCLNICLDSVAAIESLEADSAAQGDKNLDEVILWYNKFLGFRVVGGEGNGSDTDVANYSKPYALLSDNPSLSCKG